MVCDRVCFTDFSPFAFVFYFLFLCGLAEGCSLRKRWNILLLATRGIRFWDSNHYKKLLYYSFICNRSMLIQIQMLVFHNSYIQSQKSCGLMEKKKENTKEGHAAYGCLL